MSPEGTISFAAPIMDITTVILWTAYDPSPQSAVILAINCSLRASCRLYSTLWHLLDMPGIGFFRTGSENVRRYRQYKYILA